MKEVIYLQLAQADLRSLQREIAIRIVKKIKDYAAGNSADIKKLTNRPEYRLRVGDYRVLFSLIDDNIEEKRISHRKDIYE